MKILKLIIITMMLAVFSVSVLSAQATQNVLFTSNEITVKRGHHEQFKEGVKKWKECYLENKGEGNWNMWHRLQGEGNVYVMTGSKANWAEMDKDDPVNKECYAVMLNFIMPHVEKTNFNIAKNMPEISITWPKDAKHAWVTYYKVKDGISFKEIITAVMGAINNKEGSMRSIWREFQGGSSDAPDFMVSTPYKTFAALDIIRDSPLKIYTDAVGSKKAEEMRAKWLQTVTDSWSYIFTLNTEMSHPKP